MNKKAYFVVSVRNLNRLLKIARRGALANNCKTSRERLNHCIVLQNLELSSHADPDGQIQVCGIGTHTDILGAA